MPCLMLQRTSQGYDVTSQSLLLKQVERCVSVTGKGPAMCGKCSWRGRLTERAVSSVKRATAAADL